MQLCINAASPTVQLGMPAPDAVLHDGCLLGPQRMLRSGGPGFPHLPASPRRLDGGGSSVQLAESLRPLLEQQLQNPAPVRSAAVYAEPCSHAGGLKAAPGSV